MFTMNEQAALNLIQLAQSLQLGGKWQSVCDQARLNRIDRPLMLGRQFLNPFAFDDLTDDRSYLKKIATQIPRQ